MLSRLTEVPLMNGPLVKLPRAVANRAGVIQRGDPFLDGVTDLLVLLGLFRRDFPSPVPEESADRIFRINRNSGIFQHVRQ